jgi:hypothetical protein
VLLLSGCAGGFYVPDTNVTQQTPLGAIKGSVYGGHAPLTQAHVYVLQAGTGGYGQQATSLLTGGTGVSTNPSSGGDPNIPAGWEYALTDGNGEFNITGDYTCTAGLPVYLYAYGGFAAYPQSAPGSYGTNNNFSISNVSVSGSSAPYTYTFTTTTTQYAYQGEAVTFSQPYGPFFANTTYYLYSDPSTTTFTLQASTNTTSSVTGLIATITPSYNQGIVNLAVLGVCPSSGSFTTGGTLFNGTTYSPVNYVYINEVSTVAAAYAFAPFTANAAVSSAFSSTTNDATHIGTSSTNLVGIENAALNAGQLYSINGSGPVSTTFAGEGHIANATTPIGNGIISQVTIDTLADILAACVDSYSTNTTVGGSNISTQCNTLFNYASSNGVPSTATGGGTQAFDTATAAINIALHPAGPPPSASVTSSSWVNTLYSISNGIAPFAPALTTQPNDFTVGILYTAANYPVPSSSGDYYFYYTSGIAVDGIGDVWFSTLDNQGYYYILSMSPLGIINNSYKLPDSGTNIQSPYVVVDANQNIWSQGGVYTYYVQATGTTGNPYTYSSSFSTATPDSNGYLKNGTTVYVGDQSGNMFFVDPEISAAGGGTYWNLSYFPSGSFTDAGESPIPSSYFDQTDDDINGGAADGNGNIFLYQAQPEYADPSVVRVELSPTPGAPTAGNWPVTSSTTGCGNLSGTDFGVIGLAVTRSHDAVLPNSSSNSVMYISSTGTCAELTNSSLGTALLGPIAAAVDGRDYAYVLNFSDTAIPSGEGSITVLNMQAGTAAGTVAVDAALSPQYQPAGTLTSMLVQPSHVSIDPSGNLWVANSDQYDYSRGMSVVEIIGAAAPVATPVARTACNTGASPCIGYAP